MKALSSAESDLYAVTMGLSEGAHLHQLLSCLGVPAKMRLFMDSSVARSILARAGVGRVRHLAAKVIWVQDMAACGRVVIGRVPVEQNCANFGTKPLGKEVFERHRSDLGLMIPESNWEPQNVMALAAARSEVLNKSRA